MSRIDINTPLNLLGIYSQVMTLSLIWNSNLKNIFILGFGGGRLSLFFYYYLQNVTIENIDIEEKLIEIADKFFAVEFNNNQKLFIGDGEKFLENLDQDKKYSLLILDAYRGSGYMQNSFKKNGFFETCQKHLTQDGIFCINLVESEIIIQTIISDLKKIFQQVCVYKDEIACVVICSNFLIIPYEERINIAEKLDKKYHFHFPFVERSKKLTDA